jgi:hypothetical protein
MTTNRTKTGLDCSLSPLLAKHPRGTGSIAGLMARLFALGLLAASHIGHHVSAADNTAELSSRNRPLAAQESAANPPAIAAQPVAAHRIKRANFAQESASEHARYMADWIVDSNDNRQMPFLIVDKANAKVFVFNATGQIKGAAPALLGMASGDDSVPGIGQRKLSTIPPDERTTPAGRFVAALDRNLHGAEILWIDYDAAISLHRVVTSNPRERRAERLTSDTIADNRISYGCINVPVKFYEKIVSPAFKKNGIVYVLPETRSLRETFGSYDVNERARQPAIPVATPGPAQVLPLAGRTIKLR